MSSGKDSACACLGNFPIFLLFLGRLHVDRKQSAKAIFTFNALFFFKFTQARAFNGFDCARSLRFWVKMNLYRIWRSALYCTEFIGTSHKMLSITVLMTYYQGKQQQALKSSVRERQNFTSRLDCT